MSILPNIPIPGAGAINKALQPLGALGRTLYQLTFQVSPILLVNGVAQNLPGKILPIIAITEAANFVNGLLSGNIDLSLDSFFAQYTPAPGAMLQNNEVATYTFANQTTAANSIISTPLTVSMIMACPVQQTAGYYFKLAIMSALQKTLAQHSALGGVYSVITPSYVYTNCILQSMIDISSTQTKQPQWQWQLNFLQPLLALSQTQQALNGMLEKITQGGQVSAPLSWSNTQTNANSVFGYVTQAVAGGLNSLTGQ